MIYCNLKGGLGNMLFQIATAKSMALDMGTQCSFPNLNANLSLINIDNYYNPKIKHGFEYMDIFKDYNMSLPEKDISIYRYPFEYVKLDIHDNDFWIDGFFQSDKYFKHNRNEILDFISAPTSIYNIIREKYGELLKDEMNTAIHVRRGDYVYHPNHHPTQNIEYYQKGIDILKEKTNKFVIFSDDITWCKENLKIDNAYYVSNEKDYIELYFMSLCNNFIISNSSFGWWGAWLSENENKTVVGPKKWFGNAIQHNTDDILSKEWIKI